MISRHTFNILKLLLFNKVYKINLVLHLWND